MRIYKFNFHWVKVALVTAGFLVSQTSTAYEGQPVVQVQRIDVHGDIASYVEMVQRVIIRQNSVVPGLRTKVYRADFAGEEAGLVYVLVEFPSLESRLSTCCGLLNV